MLRLSLSALVLIVFSSTFIKLQGFAQDGLRPTENSVGLDGAYEFLSETTILTKPKALTKRRVAPEWQGVWFFEGDWFSQTLMKKHRLYSTYPRFHSDLGYESSAGTYTIEGNTLTLKSQMALHPLSVGRSLTVIWKLDGNTLTFTEILSPYPEDLSQGHRITTLRRINSSSARLLTANPFETTVLVRELIEPRCAPNLEDEDEGHCFRHATEIEGAHPLSFE